MYFLSELLKPLDCGLEQKYKAAPHQQPSPSFHNMTGLATDAEVTELYESKKQAGRQGYGPSTLALGPASSGHIY